MPTYKRKIMCSECPFRANAIRGWLGPCSPEQVNAVVHSDQPYICHKEIKKLSDKGMGGEEIEDKGQHCVGMARYRKSVLKTPRDKKAADFQNGLPIVPDKPVIPAWKFLEHHNFNFAEFRQ